MKRPTTLAIYVHVPLSLLERFNGGVASDGQLARSTQRFAPGSAKPFRIRNGRGGNFKFKEVMLSIEGALAPEPMKQPHQNAYFS